MDLEAVQELEVEVEETTPQGYSAYEVAVQNGFEGTETEWLASLKGPQGQPGQDGTDGTNATINGVSTINIAAGENITLEQEDGTLTINSTGGGTRDYTALTNKPSINNVTLNGNKTSSDLGLQPAGNYLISETDPVFSASASAGITNSDISNWDAKYDKPSTGIPKADLSSDVQASLGKADTALQNETYTGTITGITMNGASKGTSGVVDLGTVITQHQDLSGKQDVISSTNKLNADYIDDTNSTNKFVTSTEKTTWNGKQDVLTAGDNITIENNVISATGGSDLPIYHFHSAVASTQWTTNEQPLSFPSDDYAPMASIIQEVYSKGYTNFLLYLTAASSWKTPLLFTANRSQEVITSKPTSIAMFAINSGLDNRLNSKNPTLHSFQLNINLSWNGDVPTVTSIKMIGVAARCLTSTSDIAYTPSGDYNPATKKYVDDAVAGAGGGSSYPVYSISITGTTSGAYTFNSTEKTNLANIIADAYSKSFDYISLNIMTSENTQHAFTTTNTGVTTSSWNRILNKPATLQLYSMFVDSLFHSGNRSTIYTKYLNITLTWSGDVPTVSSAKLSQSSTQVLSTDNTVSYTPSGDYNPATKKYVDDLVTTYSGYDSSKTQILKNVNGTLTWVDE